MVAVRGDKRTRALIKQTDNESASQSLAVPHTSQGTHTHAHKSREVGNKGCHGNLSEPRHATHCSARGHPSRSLPFPNLEFTRGGRGRPSQRGPGPCSALLSPFLPSFPHKIQARSVPSLPLPSPNSCFSEIQGNIIRTQHPDTLMSPVMFPQLFQIWVKQHSPVLSKTPLFL